MTDPETIDETVGELNKRYDLDLPRLADLPSAGALAEIWDLPVTIEQNPPAPMVFKACASKTHSFDGRVDGQVIVFVVPDGAEPGPLTPCRPPA